MTFCSFEAEQEAILSDMRSSYAILVKDRDEKATELLKVCMSASIGYA